MPRGGGVGAGDGDSDGVCAGDGDSDAEVVGVGEFEGVSDEDPDGESEGVVEGVGEVEVDRRGIADVFVLFVLCPRSERG